MANEAWYVGKGGQQLGPFSTVDLKAKLATGELSSADPVWKEGMAGPGCDGQPAGLRGSAPAAPPPPPMVYASAGPSAVGKFLHDLFAGGTAEEAVSSPVVSLIEKLLGWCAPRQAPGGVPPLPAVPHPRRAASRSSSRASCG